MNIDNFIFQANLFGTEGKSFFFLLDFELQKPFICLEEQASEYGYFYNIHGRGNSRQDPLKDRSNSHITPIPISKDRYGDAFHHVIENIQKGNSYLTNLTFPTKLKSEIKLDKIYTNSVASYKLYCRDNFVIFSPECFIRTNENYIYSYPMKGTIDAKIPHAEQIILQDKKETWEHNTIVDLIRNDLAMVSHNIRVTKFRYTDRIKTNRNELLQVSSEIQGELAADWQSGVGDLLVKMLPAGSISGAPKKKTVEIIRAAEKQPRGYYTGIFGVFDGKNIDSAVNIRYVEKIGNQLQYRSGGGITAMSDLDSEYKEMLDKVYVPIN